MPKNIFYAQSGGVTAVINATACGVIEAARQHSDDIGTVFAGHNGILGALKEQLIDTSHETDVAIATLKHTPGGAFGSCRYKLNCLEQNKAEYERIIEVFKAHDIGYFFYNGGNDSQDTTHKMAIMSERMGYPLTCIGIPKTVDNDLLMTDNCPGFGSVAKYIATSIREGALDVASMAATSTQVFIMEVMGRNAGWIAASGGLACEQEGDAPHIILFPEVVYDEAKVFAKVTQSIERYGHCAIVVSEGLTNKNGDPIVESAKKDAFGHHQLGGTGHVIANAITRNLGYKCHFAVCDYLQRSARHLASQTDVDQAYALGQAAVEHAIAGTHGVMLTVERTNQTPYAWQVGTAPLSDVANGVKHMPMEFISEDGLGITQACREYMLPLIQGEAFPPFKNGMPAYQQDLILQKRPQKLNALP
tara:strand:+ start:16936 stop:18192 length:1257 start_codon:yes stop_codon:yes gene_type:complete